MEDADPYMTEDNMSYTSSEPMAPVDPASSAPARPSLLDILRKRVESSMAQEPRRQLSDFGAGMLASGSPNFFTMLAAGNRAQSEGERTRTQELRQYAEAERQAAAQRANENYRREQARIAQQRYEAEAPLRAAQAEQARAMAGFYGRRGDGTGAASDRLTATALRTAAVEAEKAVREARRLRESNPALPRLTSEEEATIRDTVYMRVLSGQNVPAPAGAVGTPPATSAAPAALIDAMGRSIR